MCKMDTCDESNTDASKGKGDDVHVTFKVENALYSIPLSEISESNFLQDLYDMSCDVKADEGDVKGNKGDEGDVIINIPYSKDLWDIYIFRRSILESCNDIGIMIKLLNMSSMFMDDKTTDLACDKIVIMLKTGYL